MLELHTTTEAVEDEERVPVFSIDGHEYTMPAVIKPHLALKYLWLLKQDGAEQASAWLMEKVLGADGFKALSEYEPLTMEQFEQIQVIIRDHTFGAMEEGRGKGTSSHASSNGRKKSPGPKRTSKT